jgi:diaminobutyrate-2-oxoglutarate transaminase
MMQGLDVGAGELAVDIAHRCYEQGLVIETSGPRDEVVKVLAPLTTPDELLLEGLTVIERAAKSSISSGAAADRG